MYTKITINQSNVQKGQGIHALRVLPRETIMTN